MARKTRAQIADEELTQQLAAAHHIKESQKEKQSDEDE